MAAQQAKEEQNGKNHIFRHERFESIGSRLRGVAADRSALLGAISEQFLCLNG